jgi:hypothetical protein
MYNRRYYAPCGAIVYNTAANLRLLQFSTDALAASLPLVAGTKLIRVGSILAKDGKLLKRAALLTGIVAGATEIFVNNPWAFAVGDALKVIAAPRTLAATEVTAIETGSGASLGTILSIDGGNNTQVSRITPAGLVVGNIITINYSGIQITYAIATTVVADECKALAAEILRRLGSSDQFRYIQANPQPTYVELKSPEYNGMMEFEALISQGAAASVGTLTTSTDAGLGKITLSAGVPAALVGMTKIGVTTQMPAGIFDADFDYTNYPQGISSSAGVSPLYGGQIKLDGLPYFDGQIAKVLPQIALIPAYS